MSLQTQQAFYSLLCHYFQGPWQKPGIALARKRRLRASRTWAVTVARRQKCRGEQVDPDGKKKEQDGHGCRSPGEGKVCFIERCGQDGWPLRRTAFLRPGMGCKYLPCLKSSSNPESMELLRSFIKYTHYRPYIQAYFSSGQTQSFQSLIFK